MKVALSILLIILFFLGGLSQEYDSLQSRDLLFVDHLIKLGDYDDAVKVLDQAKPSESYFDSVMFFKGVCFLNQRKLDSSAYYFYQVSPKTELFSASRFYSSLSSTYIEDYSKSLETLQEASFNDSLKIELKNFQQAGLALLRRDYSAYDSLRNYFSYQYYQFAKEEKALDDYREKYTSFKPKSKFTAGLLSAIIPGAGKAYVGKWGEAVSAFMMVTTLGLITTENYIKAGPLNYKTLLFGSAFTIFYVGNVWGSVISVQRYRNDFYDSHDYNIRVNLHIPLRRIFN